MSDNRRAHEVLETSCQVVLCCHGSFSRFANAKRNAVEYREIRNLTPHTNIQYKNIKIVEIYTGIVLIVHSHVYYYFRK
jgi:hypothetical protein